MFFLQIGIVGLVEWEWLVTLATIEPEDVEYTDFVTCAKNLIPQLKLEVSQNTTEGSPVMLPPLSQGCDLLVALTHMRMPNDIRLAEEVPDFHLILAGHDHHYEKREVQCIHRNVHKGEMHMLSEMNPFSDHTIT